MLHVVAFACMQNCKILGLPCGLSPPLNHCPLTWTSSLPKYSKQNKRCSQPTALKQAQKQVTVGRFPVIFSTGVVVLERSSLKNWRWEEWEGFCSLHSKYVRLYHAVKIRLLLCGQHAAYIPCPLSIPSSPLIFFCRYETQGKQRYYRGRYKVV